MILTAHVQGTPSYDVGDEIWQQSFADAIRAEAETIAGYAGPELLPSPDQAHRDALQETDRPRHEQSAGTSRR